jgi:hypothetical protein
MAFYGVYFETANGDEYRIGFEVGAGDYKPSFETRNTDTLEWDQIGQGTGYEPMNRKARALRALLPVQVAFDESHTQNEIMELVHQTVYNLNRAVNENCNYRGAHA